MCTCTCQHSGRLSHSSGVTDAGSRNGRSRVVARQGRWSATAVTRCCRRGSGAGAVQTWRQCWRQAALLDPTAFASCWRRRGAGGERTNMAPGIPVKHQTCARSCLYRVRAREPQSRALQSRTRDICRFFVTPAGLLLSMSFVLIPPHSQPRALRHVTISRTSPFLKSACHEGLTPPQAGVLTTPPPARHRPPRARRGAHGPSRSRARWASAVLLLSCAVHGTHILRHVLPGSRRPGERCEQPDRPVTTRVRGRGRTGGDGLTGPTLTAGSAHCTGKPRGSGWDSGRTKLPYPRAPPCLPTPKSMEADGGGA